MSSSLTYLSRGPLFEADRRRGTPPPHVLIPCRDDWESLAHLVGQLDRHLGGRGGVVTILDDGSEVPPYALETSLRARPPVHLERVETVRLARNLGHQRAIAIGLALRAVASDDAPTVVMDGDGEDRPEDVPRLLDALGSGRGEIVFAQRARRSEGRAFRVMYRAYRAAQRVLTGVSIDFGNFSAIPASRLPTLAVTSETWNHYPAAVLAGRLPIRRVPCDRGARIDGRSQMGWTGLVLHGMGALSVFSERIGVRVVGASLALAAALAASIAVVVGVRMGTDLAIPGWATTATGLLAVLLSQSLTVALCFVLMVLHGRNSPRFIPSRDHVPFVAGRTILHPPSDNVAHDRPPAPPVALRVR